MNHLPPRGSNPGHAAASPDCHASLRSDHSDEHAPPPPVSLREDFLFWLKLGFISFGGPAGQIAITHAELVERRRWLSERRLLHALNDCMVLPGPEAQQLATYIGWLMHRARGGLIAGTLFVLPSRALLWTIPIVRLTAACGWDGTLTRMAWFFTKAALLTFGGADAVLAGCAGLSLRTLG